MAAARHFATGQPTTAGPNRRWKPQHALGAGGTQVDLGTFGTRVGTVRVYGRFVEG